jgi:DNA adenine methylase
MYLEPFAGSLAVLYAKAPSESEIINDLHADLINIYRMMREQPDELLRRVMLTPFSRREMLDGYRPDPKLPDVERAARHLCYCWTNYASAAGRSSISGFSVDSTNSYSHKVDQYADARRALPEKMQRLERVIIESRDAVKLITTYGTRADTLIYCDPPYLRGPNAARGKWDKYQHEFEDSDHERLAAALRETRAQVVLSYYDDPRLSDLYPGWHKAAINGARRNTISNKPGHAPEVVLTNFDPAGLVPLFAQLSPSRPDSAPEKPCQETGPGPRGSRGVGCNPTRLSEQDASESGLPVNQAIPP